MDNDPLLFKIAHISDLHFSKISFSLLKLFSKQFIGNLNLLLQRSRIYKNERPFSLIQTFKEQQISHVFITGDLSTTSSKEEFQKAQLFIAELLKEKIQVITIPGNHDNYTKSSFKKKLFYDYFSEDSSPLLGYTLKTNKVCAQPLGDHFWVIRIDSTHPAPVYRSTGEYTKSHDKHLRELLEAIPATDSIIIMNHFPLFHHEHAHRIMYGADILRSTLALYPNVKLYLHGHTHKQSIADFRGSHLPIIADSGSVSHIKKGSWNCFEIYPSSCFVNIFTPDDKNRWSSQKNLSYTW